MHYPQGMFDNILLNKDCKRRKTFALCYQSLNYLINSQTSNCSDFFTNNFEQVYHQILGLFEDLLL